MIINLTSLKNVINRSVVDIMDHKNLNEDVEHFKDLNPTAENLIVVIWKLLEKEFEEQLLYRLVLRETSNNIVEYYGEEI